MPQSPYKAGEDILLEYLEQAKDNDIEVRVEVTYVKMAYVVRIENGVITLYFVPNLFVFAKEHQENLDKYPSQNGYEAVQDLLSRKYILTTFAPT